MCMEFPQDLRFVECDIDAECFPEGMEAPDEAFGSQILNKWSNISDTVQVEATWKGVARS